MKTKGSMESLYSIDANTSKQILLSNDEPPIYPELFD
jgi:hypothetical protein